MLPITPYISPHIPSPLPREMWRIVSLIPPYPPISPNISPYSLHAYTPSIPYVPHALYLTPYTLCPATCDLDLHNLPPLSAYL